MENFGVPLSDQMRPTKLEDSVLSTKDILGVRNIMVTRQMPHLILSGPPGIGKNSVERQIVQALGAEAFSVVGSSKAMKGITDFASTLSLLGPKICVINEAEALPRTAQTSLRELIEEMSHVRFLLTTNNVRKIDHAVLSRLYHIEFRVSDEDRPRIIRRLIARYMLTLSSMGIVNVRAGVERLVEAHFPDFRAIANAVEFELLRPNSSPAIRLLPGSEQ